ncbi:hypothetical protein FA13DRAFT_1791980 [Coprinellus micaceus]|uniref:Uncharacterized protein n=1 Tax=Coprinellus micaceus TaxID=71717 RepID=A0A4Y7TA65_COPMI|nr:hypothetical protein FA13DRAFT_1791980 [Coprinellus micaceus]
MPPTTDLTSPKPTRKLKLTATGPAANPKLKNPTSNSNSKTDSSGQHRVLPERSEIPITEEQHQHIVKMLKLGSQAKGTSEPSTETGKVWVKEEEDSLELTDDSFRYMGNRFCNSVPESQQPPNFNLSGSCFESSEGESLQDSRENILADLPPLHAGAKGRVQGSSETAPAIMPLAQPPRTIAQPTPSHPASTRPTLDIGRLRIGGTPLLEPNASSTIATIINRHVQVPLVAFSDPPTTSQEADIRSLLKSLRKVKINQVILLLMAKKDAKALRKVLGPTLEDCVKTWKIDLHRVLLAYSTSAEDLEVIGGVVRLDVIKQTRPLASIAMDGAVVAVFLAGALSARAVLALTDYGASEDKYMSPTAALLCELCITLVGRISATLAAFGRYEYRVVTASPYYIHGRVLVLGAYGGVIREMRHYLHAVLEFTLSSLENLRDHTAS